MKYRITFQRVTIETITREWCFDSDAEAQEFAMVEAANAHRREFTFDPECGAKIDLTFDRTTPINVARIEEKP